MTSSSSALGFVSWEYKSTDPPKTGEFVILPHQTVLIGRDAYANDVVFADPVVSRNQLEIFSIVMDEENKHPPLVFVRDCGSANGTCVNGQLIGKRPELSPARMLEDGDTITIGPYPDLVFVYHQLENVPTSLPLTASQRKEAELFRDRYIITDRTVGDGAHAVVYVAKEVSTGQHVVCKVHDIGRYPKSAREVQRIRQEATLLSTLDHPNILPIKAAFETNQSIYIISELAAGGDLYSLILRYKQLEERGIRTIVRQVLRGVAYIHSKGVAHRDIKPENVLLGITPRVPYRVMLSDFGDSAVTGPRRMKSNVGTSFYRPPECHTPGLDHDLSVDIWAVGMLTLQLFLGYEEFPGGDSVVFTSQEDIDNYLNMIFVALTDEDRISEAAKHFIRKCLAYNREKRPTARDAFYHDWLQQPKEERKRLKQLEADNILSWKPQKVKFPIIEDLTAQSTWQGNKDAHVLRSSAMWPSTTLHFSS